MFHLDRRRRRRVQFSTPLTSSPPEQLQMSPFLPSLALSRKQLSPGPSSVSPLPHIGQEGSGVSETEESDSQLDRLFSAMVSQWEESITGRHRCIHEDLFAST